MSGFIDPLRMVMGWWASAIVIPGPFVVLAEQVYTGGSRESLEYAGGPLASQSSTAGSHISQTGQ